MKPAAARALLAAPALAALALLPGCVVPAARTRPELPAPEAWRAPAAPAAESPLAALPWTDLYRDPALTALIDEALANNSDLRIAAARVDLARAQYRVQRADRLPGVSATGSFTRDSRPSPTVPGDNLISNTWSAGLAVPAWEIDLWGRVKHLSGAARARYLAAEETRRAARLSLVAEVAGAYLDLVALDTQVRIAAVTRGLRERSREIIAQRHAAGVASGLDLSQADSLVAAARLGLAEFERQRDRQENALALLLGRAPGPVPRDPVVFARALPPLLPAGLPADLVARRPDLRAAEASLHAADLDVAAARRTFLPAVSVSGFAGFVSPAFEDLLGDDRAAWNVQPAVALPLFQAGRLRANLAAQKARRQIAAESYVLAVRTALAEVENALLDHRSYVEQLAAAEAAVAAARARFELTSKRYDEGVSPYFELLDASRSHFEAELDLVRARRAAYATIIQLYRALGGGAAPEAAAAPPAASAPVPQPAAPNP
jgi:multidrug efflux system outer membrane protein